MKLRNSIFAILALFTLIPVCVLGFLSVHMTNSRVDAMAMRNLEAVSSNQVMSIQNFCRDRSTQMKTIGESWLIRDAVRYSLGESDSIAGSSYVDNLLRAQTGENTYVASISVINREFRVVGSSEEYTRGELCAMKDVGERFRSGDFWIGSIYKRHTDSGIKKLVSACCGIYVQEELIGYVVAELETTYFDELGKNTELLTEGTFYLMDEHGDIIASGGAEADDQALIGTGAYMPADEWEPVAHTDSDETIYRRSYRGSDYLVSYVELPQSDWKVYLAENLGAQWKKNLTYAYSALFVLSVLGIGMICVQRFFTKRLMAPIEQIMKIFVRIRKDKDYSLRIPAQSTAEFGELAYGINELLSYVEQQDRKEKARQRHLEHLAQSDPLTGIQNKKAIEQEMRRMIDHASEAKEAVVVGFLDIDNFRDYNTNYGHQSGDSIIRFVAGIMQEELPGVVGRNGGDEFVFCCDSHVDSARIRAVLTQMLQRLNREYESPEDGAHIPVPCSIGVVIAADASAGYEELVRRADKAMYEAKANGKNQFYIDG